MLLAEDGLSRAKDAHTAERAALHADAERARAELRARSEAAPTPTEAAAHLERLQGELNKLRSDREWMEARFAEHSAVSTTAVFDQHQQESLLIMLLTTWEVRCFRPTVLSACCFKPSCPGPR